MGEPVDTGAEAIMDDATLEATFAHIERWSELDLPICANLRMHCKALQSALAAAHNDKLVLTGMLQQSRASLTAAQQRISDLEAQCARVQRGADRYQFLRDNPERVDMISREAFAAYMSGADKTGFECFDDAIDAAMAEKEAG